MEFSKPNKLINYKEIVDKYKLIDNKLTANTIEWFTYLINYSENINAINLALEVINDKEFNFAQKEFALYFLTEETEFYVKYKDEFNNLTKELYQLPPSYIYNNYIRYIKKYDSNTSLNSYEKQNNNIKEFFNFIIYRVKFLMSTKYLNLLNYQFYDDDMQNLGINDMQKLDINKLKNYYLELKSILMPIKLNPIFKLKGLDKIYEERNTLTQNQIFLLNELIEDYDYIEDSKLENCQDFFLDVIKENYNINQIHELFDAFPRKNRNYKECKGIINNLYTPLQIKIIAKLTNYYKLNNDEVKKLVPLSSGHFYNQKDKDSLSILDKLLNKPYLRKYIETNISYKQLYYVAIYKEKNIHSEYIEKYNLTNNDFNFSGYEFICCQKALELGVSEEWALLLGKHFDEDDIELLVKTYGVELDKLNDISKDDFTHLSHQFFDFLKYLDSKIDYIKKQYGINLKQEDFDFVVNMDKYSKYDKSLYDKALNSIIYHSLNKTAFLEDLNTLKNNISYLDSINYSSLTPQMRSRLYNSILRCESIVDNKNKKIKKSKSNDLER